jgi:hypothetical protein
VGSRPIFSWIRASTILCQANFSRRSAPSCEWWREQFESRADFFHLRPGIFGAIARRTFVGPTSASLRGSGRRSGGAGANIGRLAKRSTTAVVDEPSGLRYVCLATN